MIFRNLFSAALAIKIKINFKILIFFFDFSLSDFDPAVMELLKFSSFMTEGIKVPVQ